MTLHDLELHLNQCCVIQETYSLIHPKIPIEQIFWVTYKSRIFNTKYTKPSFLNP